MDASFKTIDILTFHTNTVSNRNFIKNNYIPDKKLIKKSIKTHLKEKRVRSNSGLSKIE
jgi:hypothetical protein